MRLRSGWSVGNSSTDDKDKRKLERDVMGKSDGKIKVRWEYSPAPDAAARLAAAFDLLFGQISLAETGDDQNLTENSTDSIMSHDES